MPSDLLERMRRNPAGDWEIGDVEVLSREYACFFGPARERRIVTQSIRPLGKY